VEGCDLPLAFERATHSGDGSLAISLGNTKVKLLPTLQVFYLEGRVAKHKFDQAWQRDWRGVYTALSMVSRCGPIDAVGSYPLRVVVLGAVNRFMGWYLPHFLTDPDKAAKLIKSLSTIGRDRLMGATSPVEVPPHMCTSFRRLFPELCFHLLHGIDTGSRAEARAAYFSYTSSQRACLNSFLTVNRSTHQPVAGREDAEEEFLGRITEKPKTIREDVLYLWRRAAAKLGQKHYASTRNRNESHLSLAFTSTFEKTRTDSGKYGQYLEEVLPWMNSSAAHEFGLIPDGDVYDCFGRLIALKDGPPAGSVSNYLCADQARSLGDLMALWSTGVYTTMGRLEIPVLMSRSGIPLFRSREEAVAFKPPKLQVDTRVFTIAELGTKWRPANASAFRFSMAATVLRHVAELSLKTDKRVALGSMFWSFKTQMERNLQQRFNRSVLFREFLRIRSEDLSGATDRLEWSALQAQIEGWVTAWSPTSYVRRLLPSLALPSHAVHYEYGDEGPQVLFSTKCTMLGDSCSMFMLTLHQLVKLEAASILYSAGLDMSCPLSNQMIDDAGIDYEDPSVSSVLGDDLIAVAPERWIKCLDLLSTLVHDVHSPGKDYLSDRLEHGSPQAGIYLEEIFWISVENGYVETHVDNTLKMRLVTDTGPPSGPIGIARTVEPTFGRLMSSLRMLKWQEDTDFHRISCKVLWENFPKLRQYRDYYPVTGLTELGGLGLSAWGGWQDRMTLCPGWYRHLLFYAPDNPLYAWCIRNSAEIDGHQVRNAVQQLSLNLPPPLYHSLVEAQEGVLRDDILRDRHPEVFYQEIEATVVSRDGSRRPNWRLRGAAMGRPSTGLISGLTIGRLLSTALGQEALYTGTVRAQRFKPYTLSEWADRWDLITTGLGISQRDVHVDDLLRRFPNYNSVRSVPNLFATHVFYDANDPEIIRLTGMVQSIRLPSLRQQELGG